MAPPSRVHKAHLILVPSNPHSFPSTTSCRLPLFWSPHAKLNPAPAIHGPSDHGIHGSLSFGHGEQSGARVGRLGSVRRPCLWPCAAELPNAGLTRIRPGFNAPDRYT